MQSIDNNVRKRGLALSVLVFGLGMVFVAGCQLMGPSAPSKSPEQVIREGISKLFGITAYSYDVALKGDLKDKTGSPVKFDLDMSGQVDVRDAKDPKFTLKLGGSVSDGGSMSGDGSLDLRLNKDALYFNVLALNVSGVGEIPPQVKAMTNKWWKIALPAGAFDEVSKVVPQAEESKMTPEQLKVKKLLDETNFFVAPNYVDIKPVKGENCYHYTVNLDKQALLDFLKKSAEAQGQVVSDVDMADAKTALEKVDVTGEVYVGVNTGILHQLTAVIKMAGGEDASSGTVNFTLTLWDVGKAVILNAPTDVTEFPLQEFMNGFMNASGAALSTETASTQATSDSLGATENAPTQGSSQEAVRADGGGNVPLQ